MLTDESLPKISIITPSYNQGKYLERTILSVIQQNYPNLEYIIIDGGSVDNSVDIIKKYKSKISYWVSEKDRGQSHAMNKGFQRVTGDIIGWINSDDWYEDGVFAKIAETFLLNPTGLWIGDCIRHYEATGRSFTIKPAVPTLFSMLRYWRTNFCPPQPSIFFSGVCLKKSGFLDERLNYAMDLDLWLRMALHFDFHYINMSLSNYLIHDASKSGEGPGFKKFRKEWKLVCFKYVKMLTVNKQVLFYLDYFYHRIVRPSSLKEY